MQNNIHSSLRQSHPKIRRLDHVISKLQIIHTMRPERGRPPYRGNGPRRCSPSHR
ncbi:hypothetical protein OSTOST_17983, partial [Ostertagia ostertagi]